MYIHLKTLFRLFQRTFRSLEMHSKGHFKICISLDLSLLENYKGSKLKYYFPERQFDFLRKQEFS